MCRPRQFTYWSNLSPILEEHSVLIAGTIGSGKSVLLDDLIYNLSAQPLRKAIIGIIDLKRVQFNKWKRLPHLQQLGIAKDLPSAFALIDRVTAIMEHRYAEMDKTGDDIYTGETKVYLIIDELADLMSHKGVEAKLTHLLRLARASGITTICATQSPSRKVITAPIQNNVVCRVGLRCSSPIESRQVVFVGGCERLPRYGLAYLHTAEGLSQIAIPMTDRKDIDIRVNEWCAMMHEDGRKGY